MVDKLNPRQRLSHKLRDGKYRAKKMGCPYEHVSIAAAEAAGLLAVKNCYYCERQLNLTEIVSVHDLTAGYTLEHKEPLKLGGAHKIDNLAKACQQCNQE